MALVANPISADAERVSGGWCDTVSRIPWGGLRRDTKCLHRTKGSREMGGEATGCRFGKTLCFCNGILHHLFSIVQSILAGAVLIGDSPGT